MLIREGRSHSWWGNLTTNKRSSVPRHSGVNDLLSTTCSRGRFAKTSTFPSRRRPRREPTTFNQFARHEDAFRDWWCDGMPGLKPESYGYIGFLTSQYDDHLPRSGPCSGLPRPRYPLRNSSPTWSTVP